MVVQDGTVSSGNDLSCKQDVYLPEPSFVCVCVCLFLIPGNKLCTFSLPLMTSIMQLLIKACFKVVFLRRALKTKDEKDGEC